jgi:gliding motility-associated-like protein
VPDSSEIKFGESVELNSTYTNAVGTPVYIWEPTTGLSCSECSNPVATPDETTVYSLTIIDENGCSATDRVIVAVNYIKVLYVPNAFTPNNDGVNDRFLVFTDGAKSISFKIFNRWGEKIFETTTIGEGWDGTYLGKEMNPGVYVYYVEVTYQDDSIQAEKGSVTLIR